MTSGGDAEESGQSQPDGSSAGTDASAVAAAAAAAAWASDGGHFDDAQGQFVGAGPSTAGESSSTTLEAADPATAQGDNDDDPSATAGGATSPNSRVLSSTKRAAQNRAAQRAFRERRDKHVKELEARSQQFETLQASYNELQTRYNEALGILNALRVENEMLRGGAGGEGNGEAGGGGGEQAGPSGGGANEFEEERGLDAVASAAVEAARLTSEGNEAADGGVEQSATHEGQGEEGKSTTAPARGKRQKA